MIGLRSSPLLGLAVAWIGLAAGCGNNEQYMTPQRMDCGLVVILPGIEGESPLNHDIRQGLIDGHVPCALPIYNWGRPLPLVGPMVNQVDFIGNRLAGARIADMIIRYQDDHPGAPVYIIGHSGGGGVAVFAAEAMPEGHKIDGLILLAASITKTYDLTKAMAHCRSGLVNFYNPADLALLGVGTTLMGNVDGTHGPSAGLEGFDRPAASDPPEKRAAYGRVFQVRLTEAMTGGGEPHAAATQAKFVSRYVARWVLSRTWPANGSRRLASR